MAVASMFRTVFPVAKARHKRSQSNFRAIAVLITTTFVSTVLSIFFSDHVELHARHVGGGLGELGHRESWATLYYSSVKHYDQVLPSNKSTIHYLLFDVTSLSSPCSVTILCQEIDYIEKFVKN